MANQHPHPACLCSEELLKSCRIIRTKGSGPGGQRRNKVETAIEITHIPSGIQGRAEERRSQEENRKIALWRLRLNLAIHTRITPRENSEPSALWKSRCQGGRIHVNAKHADLPALIAEALDFLHANEMELQETAKQLNCSPSQFIKLIKLSPLAFEELNRQRKHLGQKALH